MTKKRRLVLAVSVVLLGVGYLAFTGFQEAAMYYLRVDELLAKGPEVYGQKVRVTGIVLDGTIDYRPKDLLLTFELAGEKRTLPVWYNGVVPDTFAAGREGVVEGRLGEDGVFVAELIMVKCPSRYEPQE